MLTDEHLIVEARRLATLNQRLPVLLLLAHVPRPAKTRLVADKGLNIGFRQIRRWNVTDILKAADQANQVVQLAGGWQLLEPGFVALKDVGVDLNAPSPTKQSDSIIPRELVSNTRRYIEKVVSQINGSYDHGFYDCCAVMCRRLGETLIIEVYEAHDRAKEIKGADGNFLMLNGLLDVLKKDSTIHLGRNAKRGLDELKELGDKSAHNRRFNAIQPDINAIKSNLRTVTEELLHLANFSK